MSTPFVVPSGRAEERFRPKYAPLTNAEAQAEALRCIYCYDAPCIKACPTAIDIPTFIKKIATDNLRGSARTILDANLLGKSCSQACPVEVLCEGACVYVPFGRAPIAIGRLQRHAMDHGASDDLFSKLPRSGKSIGLVGSGPAALACAGTLERLGHHAVIYERDAIPGGLNSTAIAPYKLNVLEALEDADLIRRLGAEFQFGVEVGKEIDASTLLQRHDALFLAPGLGPDARLGIPGEEGPGVLGATSFIRSMKLDPKFSVRSVGTASVAGGGNTAIDVVRALRGLGVPEVRLLYRNRESDLKAYRHEWEAAKKEGVVLQENAVVARVEREQDRLEAVHLASGARLRCDLLIVAIGQSKLRHFAALFPGVTTTEAGLIAVDATTGVTKNPRIFAGGDAVSGGEEVVNAVAAGQRAAKSIHAMLSARD